MTRSSLLVLFFLMAAFQANELFAVLLVSPLAILILFKIHHLKSKYITAEEMFWFVPFLFFVISPMQLIKNGYIGETGPISFLRFESVDFMFAMSIVFIFYATAASYDRFNSAVRHYNNNESGAIEDNMSCFPSMAFFIANIIVFLLYIYLQGGMANVLVGRLQKTEVEVLKAYPVIMSAFHLVFSFFLLSFVVIQRGKVSVLWKSVIILTVIVMLAIAYNPFNTPRFNLIAAWVPVFLIFLRGKLNSSLFYIVAFLFIIFVMPIISLTSRYGLDDLDAKIFTFNIFSSNLPADVFDILVFAVTYYYQEGLAFGENLFATLQSLVPSFLFPDKRGYAGIVIGDQLFNLGSITGNLSFFIAGDLFLDFHIPGVILGAILIRYLFFTTLIRARRVFFSQEILGYIYIGVLPIIVRGPLGGGILSFCLSLIFAYFIVAKLTIVGRIKA
jgi:hypothetical protein